MNDFSSKPRSPSPPPKSRAKPPARRSGPAPLSAVLGRGDLGYSLLFVFPLFLVYGVGVLAAPTMNGVDFVTRNLYAAVGYSTRNYLFVYGGLALVFGLVILWMRRHGALHRFSFLGVVLEAAVYALTLGSFIVFVMRNLLGIHDAQLHAASPFATLALGKNGVPIDIVLSLGAGVFEELVFRLGLFAGLAALLRVVLPVPHTLAVLVAGIVSSLLFSAAHHMGALGEPWSTNVFIYRSIAGAVFATIFYYRSLAHAVYTHAFYDVYVGLFLS
jgi:membrane protease YdiL (CAAX protease family)